VDSPVEFAEYFLRSLHKYWEKSELPFGAENESFGLTVSMSRKKIFLCCLSRSNFGAFYLSVSCDHQAYCCPKTRGRKKEKEKKGEREVRRE
jgi:hypothetical protein